MKVLHIIDTLWLGGAQTILKDLFENQRDNNDIFLYALRQTSPTINIEHKNVSVHSSKSRYSLLPLIEIKILIERNNIRILHCQLPRSHVFGYLLKKLFFPEIKLIIHEQGDIFEKGIILPFLLNNFQHKVDKFISCSKTTKQKLIDKANINPENITVLYNFVNLKRFNTINTKIDIQRERENIGIKKDFFVIGFAGRLIERKGWREFIIASSLLRDNKNLIFLIAGDGSQKKEMQDLIRKYELKDKVIYLGYISDMSTFYPLLNCLVVPSHWEPMGMTEIEAQAMGIPVIASNVSGLNEIITDNENGLLFEAENSVDLATKINNLLDNKDLRNNLIGKGYKSVKKYSLETFMDQLHDIYNKCIK